MSEDAKLPRYRDLPIDATRPPGSAWGVFGDDDEVGTVNLLTPSRVATAASLVKQGAVFSLNWDLEKPSPPILGRQPLRHHILELNPGTDDYYDNFYLQASSQWDSLAHMQHPEYGYYNGRWRADITGRPGSRNGIDNWARRGIVGRFALLDLERYRTAIGKPIQQDAMEVFTADDLDRAIAHQGLSLEVGDILMLRFGWLGWYERASQEIRDDLGAKMAGPGVDSSACPGLASDAAMVEWLWDRHIAAVVADNPALEALPYVPTVEGFLHWKAIPLLGLAVGEMFVLDALAADCADDGTYVGLFTAAPLNKVGGSGSTANALAMK